jgi:uroporphyrinogen-III synthase
MANSNVDNLSEQLREVKTILVSQPLPQDPQKNPYATLEAKFGIRVDFRSFTEVVGVEAKEFRKDKVNLPEFTAVIFSSKNAVDHFFRMCEEMRAKMSPETKYFCLNENIALYLQKFIQYRKRKVFYGERSIEDLKNALLKHKKKEKFLLPMSNLGAREITDFLKEKEIEYTEALMFKTISADLSDLSDITYDMLVFFTPQAIDSVFENFPDFKQNFTRIATYGKTTYNSAVDRSLVVQIPAPTPEAPSMTGAIELYLKKSNKA